VQLEFPFNERSVYRIYTTLLNDSNTELIQGLSDLERLGHEDWRFALVQTLCGINYNKDKYGNQETAPIKAVLIDKKDATVATFVAFLLNDIAAEMDILKFFNTALVSEEEYIIDFNLILDSIAKCAQNLVEDIKIIGKVTVPQLITTVYTMLREAVGKVEGYIVESTSYRRHLFTFVFSEIEEEIELYEI